MEVRAVFIITAMLAVQACNTLHAQDVPARIVDPTPASRAELARALGAALGGAPVTIADDALTRNSLLTIERRPPRDLEGRPSTGRVLEAPEQFRLVLSGTRCVLVHERTAERWELMQADCRPE